MMSSADLISKSANTALFAPCRCISTASGSNPLFAIGKEVNTPNVINTGKVLPLRVRRNLYLRISSPPFGVKPVPRASRLPLSSRTTSLIWSSFRNLTTVRWLTFSTRASRMFLTVSRFAAAFAIIIVGQLPN